MGPSSAGRFCDITLESLLGLVAAHAVSAVHRRPSWSWVVAAHVPLVDKKRRPFRYRLIDTGVWLRLVHPELRKITWCATSVHTFCNT